MKLLVVGSSPQSNIYLNSQYVSGYHAEIILLDNGDILLCDKNSTNGTTLNGAKLAPNVEVLVRRGDNVVFADTPLDWTRVPTLSVDSTAKRLISIGSHARNQIHVAGDKVSRFHAVIKEGTDGKWYIRDFSTNGTTVNNVRIPKDTNVRLKSTDEIKCAGIPVPNPVPQSPCPWWKYVLAAVLALVLVGGAAVLAVKKPWDMSENTVKVSRKPLTGSQLYERYASSTAIIVMGYHYKVTAGSLDIKSALGTDEIVVINNSMLPYDENEENSLVGLATGFYISPDGLIATNLHVAKPWLFDDCVQPVGDLVRSELNRLSHTVNSNYANYISQVKVDGVMDFMYAVPHGQYFDGHNAMSCIDVVSSDDVKKDIAIIRAMLPSKKLQDGTTYVDVNTIPDKTAYKPGTKIFTIGFPKAEHLQDIEKQTLKAIHAEGAMNASDSEFNFGHSAATAPGSSGSPVFNEYGQLVGVVSSMYGLGYNFAVRAEYIKKLLDQKEIAY